MGKAARSKKQPFRAVKMSRGEMENVLEGHIKNALPEDMRNTPLLQEMVRGAMTNDLEEEELYALSNNILTAAVEWAEDQMLEGEMEHSAMEITATPAIPSGEEGNGDRESALFRYTWNDDEAMWDMVNHSALHLHEVFHNAITISHRNIPQGETLTPAQLTITFGDEKENGFTPALSYGWHLSNLTTTPAAVVVPLTSDNLTTEPGPVNLMEYFITEFLPTKVELNMEMREAENEIHHLTHQAMDAILREGEVNEGAFSLLSMYIDDMDEGDVYTGSMEWHLHGGIPHVVEDSEFNKGANPFTIMAEAYWGIWEDATIALFSKEGGDIQESSVMAWHVTPGVIEPMSARETEDLFAHGEAPEGDGDVKMKYLEAYPIELHELGHDLGEDEE